MARKPPQQTLDVEDVFPTSQATQLRSIQVPEPAPDPVDYDDVTALNNVLAELGEDDAGGGFVTVFRETIEASGKKPDEYLERFPASEFSLDNLKARWGAGKYKISVYQEGRILTRKVITIAKDPNAVAPIATAAPAATDLSPILSAIQQSNEKTIGAIMALAQGQAKTPSRTEMLQEMQIMREMFAPAGGSPAPQPYNPIELMKLGMEMANGGSGGGESNNSWFNKMMETFGPALVPALTSAVTPKEPARRASTVALPAPVARPDPLPSTPTENPVNIIIAQYLNMLKTAASKQAPVEEYADSILNSIPSAEIPGLEEMLKPADWREKTRQYTDAIELYPDWFTSLRDTVLQFIEDDRQIAVEVSGHLTPVAGAGSVINHENADGTKFDQPEGDTSSIT